MSSVLQEVSSILHEVSGILQDVSSILQCDAGNNPTNLVYVESL